jgi:two-component system, OmpR family, sensor histidine kinase VicK
VHDPQAGLADCLVEFVEQFAVQAKLIVPIVLTLNHPPNHKKQKATNQLWGLLIAHHCQAPHDWSDYELELMQQLADQISIAIAHGELLENLEEVVARRTVELREANLNLQQEIADRQQAEDALRRNEEQLRLITNALPVLIAYVDARQSYQFNNQAYEDWLGQSPGNIHQQHLKQVWGKECYQRMQPWIKKALSGEVVTYENEIQLVNNTIRTVSVTYIPHREGERHKVKGFFALTSDISDHKAIERMKDEFISVVSHELRTPLTSIHSALKILATGRLGNLSQDGQQMLQIADDNTDRLVRLVNNVLDLQRIESGAVQMHRQACNAADLMVKATEAMQAMAQQHHIQLITEPMVIELWADADYIVQALTNLLSNAIKFSHPQGRVWLTAARSQPQEIQFQIRDEGLGIPTKQLEQIFERFHQVDASNARKRGGTGLGLTICRKIIEQHGGSIWVESAIGKGSAFIFTLPVLRRPKEKE